MIKKHRVLLNCTTLIKGGALQVARSVFEEAIKDNEIEWYFAIHEKLYFIINDLLQQGLQTEQLIVLKVSPARNKQMRKLLKLKVETGCFDAVFTLFGPAYVNFSVPHLCGIADGWVTHANKEAYQLLPNIKEKIRTFLLCQYKLWWYKKADRWCVEAKIAKECYQSKSKKSSELIDVIPNAVNQIFQDYSNQIIERKLGDDIKIFCLGADYWHKNYQIIPELLYALKEKTENRCIFYITLPEHSAVCLKLMQNAKNKGVEANIINLGVIALTNVIEQYIKCDILFFPSVLETFSVTPLEALYMNMPMIISNIPANKEVLKEQAIYISSFNVEEMTAKFIYLISNYSQEVQKLQVLKKNNYFKSIATTQNRFHAYKNILKAMIK